VIQLDKILLRAFEEYYGKELGKVMLKDMKEFKPDYYRIMGILISFYDKDFPIRKSLKSENRHWNEVRK
jgi:hypothetical protein